jgi:crotonobetainyl-CoA:carnitine CoA-transferase CaiB-like acyl-CoA transferase
MAETGLKHILDGYTVLDFTQVLAGPTVTRLMAEMGAEIIKVELAPNGEISRSLPYLRNGRSAYFIQQNRGKKSLCIDAKHAKGLAILKQLVKQVDVVLENFAPGVIGRLGLDYETVKALNPRVIMCSISAFGQTGPLSHLPGYDYIAQAYSGITSMIGEKDGQPYFPLPGIGDVSTGVHATAAINGALLYRERTGQGQYVDIALLDAYFHCHELNVQMYSASGGDIKPTRSGTQHYAICPSGLYKGRETYLFILALPHQWSSVCKAIGRPDLVEDPRFVDNEARVRNTEAVVRILEDWIVSLPSDEAALRALEETRVPVAPVLSVEQAVNHPHMRQRQTVRTVTDRAFGEFQIPGMPLRFSAFPDSLPLEAPFLGEHNDEILTHYLAYSAEHVRALEKEGVLKREVSDPPDRPV